METRIMKKVIFLLSLTLLCALPILARKRRQSRDEQRRFGTYLGDFNNRFHEVAGGVYAVDSRTLFIKNFAYDGQGPDAFFYAGYNDAPSGEGFLIPDEKGTSDVLKSYKGQDIVLTLPSGKTLRNLKWISVWCRAFDVNFGELSFPNRIDYPRPKKIPALNGIHDVASDKIVVVDAQTLLIPKFSYDGSAPDAHFWVGTGPKPGPEGSLVMDENGSDSPLRKYDEKTLVVVLPGDLTVYDIDWFSVWCIAFFVDFGSIKIPRGLNVPPSLRMLGIEPQTKLNCEILDDEKGFEVRWAIAGKSIVLQLVGKVDDGEYMSFGLSNDIRHSRMIGGDVTVAWMNRASGKGYAQDYYLDAKSQCAGSSGSCPDKNLQKNANNVRLLNSAVINDYTMLTYRQPLRASDIYDLDILANQSQAVIWALGPINSKGEVSYHSKRLRGDLLLNFGRVPEWNCPIAGKSTGSQNKRRISGSKRPAASNSEVKSWDIPPISCDEPEDGVFFAQIGPTGGEKGYAAITGHVGWGIAWYINGLLIPEIHVVRGKTYTFVVEGGNDPESPAAYHPFYITDDEEGGYQFKTEAQRRKSQVYAGVDYDQSGEAFPSSTGRLCEWKESPEKPAEESSSFGEYQRSLVLNCQEGQPGVIQWTPDDSTPDLVYYQCFTHRFLGWKIHVHDSCET